MVIVTNDRQGKKARSKRRKEVEMTLVDENDEDFDAGKVQVPQGIGPQRTWVSKAAMRMRELERR